MSDRFIPNTEVRRIAGGISRTTLWRWVRDGHFPKPTKIGPNKNGWLESQVEDWIQTRQQAAA